MKIKRWYAVVRCIRTYEPLDSHGFRQGKYYLIIRGRLIDGRGRASVGRYEGVSSLEGAFYAEFQTIISSSSSTPKTLPRQ